MFIAFNQLSTSNSSNISLNKSLHNPKVLNFDGLTRVKESELSGAYISNDMLEAVNFPALMKVDMNGLSGAFICCDNLKTVTFPRLMDTETSALLSAFASCKNLEKIDFPMLSIIGGGDLFLFFSIYV